MTMPDLSLSLPPNTDVKVMQWPANVCINCAHLDCLRRRRERNVPCAICNSRIRIGQSYRVLSRVEWEVVSQVHLDCVQPRTERRQADDHTFGGFEVS
jgi:hypothetical protein